MLTSKRTLPWRYSVATLCLVGFLSACGSGSDDASEAPTEPARKTATISILAINDFHGRLENGGTALVRDPANPAGTRATLGGAAYLQTRLQQLQASNPQGSIVVANGDLIGASPLVSRAFNDEPAIEVLNALGVQVSSVGNHEFDNGKQELLRLINGGCRAGDVIGVETCLREGQFEGARFDYLGANVIDTDTNALLLPGHVVKTIDGVKLGFIGLTLQDTPSVVAAGGTDGLEFADEVASINALIPQLKQESVAAIAVLLHNGGTTQAATINEQHCNNLSPDFAALLAGISAEVDVVFTAHTHRGYQCVLPDGKLLISGASYGQLISQVELTIDLATNGVIDKRSENHPVVNDIGALNTDGVAIEVPAMYPVLGKDPGIAAMVDFYRNLIKPITDQVVGQIDRPMAVEANASGESVLANLVADIYLWETSERPAYASRPAQIALTNLGGVRADLSTTTVTYGQLYDVMPFGNIAVTRDMTGAQIYRLLEQQWEAPQPSGNSRMLGFSTGFAYSWDARQPEGAPAGTGQRVVAGSVTLHGVPIALEQTYRVTSNDYIAGGGDNMTIMRETTNGQDGRLDLDFTVDYFRQAGLVAAPAQNRITRLN